jgi:hypothetical protein
MPAASCRVIERAMTGTIAVFSGMYDTGVKGLLTTKTRKSHKSHTN